MMYPKFIIVLALVVLLVVRGPVDFQGLQLNAAPNQPGIFRRGIVEVMGASRVPFPAGITASNACSPSGRGTCTVGLYLTYGQSEMNIYIFNNKCERPPSQSPVSLLSTCLPPPRCHDRQCQRPCLRPDCVQYAISEKFLPFWDGSEAKDKCLTARFIPNFSGFSSGLPMPYPR